MDNTSLGDRMKSYENQRKDLYQCQTGQIQTNKNYMTIT